jgi:hypothetical protein
LEKGDTGGFLGEKRLFFKMSIYKLSPSPLIFAHAPPLPAGKADKRQPPPHQDSGRRTGHDMPFNIMTIRQNLCYKSLNYFFYGESLAWPAQAQGNVEGGGG